MSKIFIPQMAHLKDSGDTHKSTIAIFNPHGYRGTLPLTTGSFGRPNISAHGSSARLMAMNQDPTTGSSSPPLTQFFNPTVTAYDTKQNKISVG